MTPSPPFRIAGSFSTGIARSFASLVDEATTGELVLRAPAWQNLGWTALCLALASPTFFIRPLPATIVASCAFFGLGAIVFALSCHPNASYVRLTARGMTVVNLFRSVSYAWDDVTNIGITNVQYRTLVGFDTISVAARRPGIAALDVTLYGYRCALNSNFGLPVRTLATLLIEVRARALASRTS